MKLSKTNRKSGRTGTYVLGRAAISGKFSQPANEPPAGGAPAGGGTGGGDGGGEPKTGTGDGDKTLTQAEVNRIAAREKAEGKAAAERAITELLGCTPAEAKAVLDKSREADEAKKTEAEKDREKAAQERAEAEKAKADAARETHAARIERALAALGFTGDEAASRRAHGMVTVAVGASYEDVLSDVTELKKTLNPELFGEKAGKPTGRGLPNGDPKGAGGKPPAGEDAYAAGQRRFQERRESRKAYNPFAKQQ